MDPTNLPRLEAIAFDLLTALVDSWTLWISVAGDEATGRAWRTASLRVVTGAGEYRPYEDIVHEAAGAAGLTSDHAQRLLASWGELRPWPEAPDVLRQCRAFRVPLAVVTDCSQVLAERAAAATGCQFDVVMSAERASVYKTDPRAYRAGLAALGLPPERVLFVAGLAHDVPGAGAVGMPVYWSNRQRLPWPEDGPAPRFDEPNLLGLPEAFRLLQSVPAIHATEYSLLPE